MGDNLFDRLFSRAMIQPNGCWEFSGERDKDGYGKIKVAGRRCMAHRVAYDLCTGDIPDGMFVCHTCDNPPCVNPAHLWLGDAQANIDDSIAKGRQCHLRGEASGPANLTDEQAREAYRLSWEGRLTQREIADELGTTQGNVWKIKHRQRWKHLWELWPGSLIDITPPGQIDWCQVTEMETA